MNNTKYTLRFVYDGEQEGHDEKYDNEVSLIMRLLGIFNRINAAHGEKYQLKVTKSDTIHTEIKGDE